MNLLENYFRFMMCTPLGDIEIYGTEKFITAIVFTDENCNSEITKNFDDFPFPIQQCVAELTAYFAGELKKFSFPYTQAGTAFRQRVWQELSSLPYGETVSYLEISKRLGDVKAIRAAASANGKNNIAIVVPCHRVIGNDGSLTGYSGGLWRKKWLLAHEYKYSGKANQLKMF